MMKMLHKQGFIVAANHVTLHVLPSDFMPCIMKMKIICICPLILLHSILQRHCKFLNTHFILRM